MPQHESDKVKREIEELLDKLDSFVPEERLASKRQSRRKAASGPTLIDRIWSRARRLSLGHVMLAGVLLLLLGYIAPHSLGSFRTPVLLLGLVLTIGAFALAVINGDSRRTIAGGPTQKRWRGQVIDYSEPGPASRLRDWWRRRRR
jgi:VIT1/CCC1 family predicted Fe2+/Mn2+ transporter